jgi:hypothetical protein
MMLKKIFLPWLVIGELERQLIMRRAEEAYLRDAINTLMKERARLRPKRDKSGRFTQ